MFQNLFTDKQSFSRETFRILFRSYIREISQQSDIKKIPDYIQTMKQAANRKFRMAKHLRISHDSMIYCYLIRIHCFLYDFRRARQLLVEGIHLNIFSSHIHGSYICTSFLLADHENNLSIFRGLGDNIRFHPIFKDFRLSNCQSNSDIPPIPPNSMLDPHKEDQIAPPVVAFPERDVPSFQSLYLMNQRHLAGEDFGAVEKIMEVSCSKRS
eukprot:Sdes_comp19001_c0_seq1m9543